jgi:hypothetical protein
MPALVATGGPPVLRVTNLLIGLVHSITWRFWSDPVAQTKSKPRPPRRPTLAVIVGTIPADVFAVVRMSWFRKGQPFEVEEFQILDCPDATAIFHGTVGQALQLGADVSVVTTYSAETLGILQP